MFSDGFFLNSEIKCIFYIFVSRNLIHLNKGRLKIHKILYLVVLYFF